MSEQNGRKPVIYFSDFDGTISVKDVGNELHRRFSHPRWLTPNRSYKSGRISSRDCLWSQYEFFRGDRREIEAFVLSREIDPGFVDFARWTRLQDIPLVILSDGLGFYIELLLEKHGLGGLPYFSNQAVFEGDRIRIEFPHSRPDCKYGCGCGNCKPAHMTCHADYERVYIGDGISDRYGAQEADRIYAKRLLADYCRERGMEYTPFRTFHDVLEAESRRLCREVSTLNEWSDRQ